MVVYIKVILSVISNVIFIKFHNKEKDTSNSVCFHWHQFKTH